MSLFVMDWVVVEIVVLEFCYVGLGWMWVCLSKEGNCLCRRGEFEGFVRMGVYLWIGFLVMFVVVLWVSVFDFEVDVFVFNVDNIDEMIKGYFFIVVEFYVFWCGYCKKLVFEVSFGFFIVFIIVISFLCRGDWN